MSKKSVAVKTVVVISRGMITYFPDLGIELQPDTPTHIPEINLARVLEVKAVDQVSDTTE